MKIIAFVDDHDGYRTSLSNVLETPKFGYKVYQYNNGQDFVTRFPKEGYTPDIVLMDIRMQPMNGYETTAWIKEKYPAIPILAFSDLDHPEAIIEISRCGANGCTHKFHYPIEDFVAIVERIIRGETHYDTVQIHKLVKKYLAMDKKDIHEGFCSLTRMEKEVLKLAAYIETVEEKASRLCISKPTFNTHISHIYKKLNIQKAAALQNMADMLGMIDRRKM